MSDGRKAPPGWYPHPSMVDTRRYWDGEAWTDAIAPVDAHPVTPGTTPQQSQLAVVGILAASIIGVIMAMQSASLLTGTGTQWTGAAIALAAGCATYVLRRSIPTWLRIISVVAAIFALANVLYLESQLEQKREEINQILP
jgi:hypothetical protein